MKKKIWWIVGIVVIISIIVIISKQNKSPQGVEVNIDSVQYRTIIETVNASGKLYSEDEVKVSPDVSGEIIELFVEAGDSVTEGKILARIYPDIYRSQRDQVRASVDQALAQLATVKDNLEGLKITMQTTKNQYERQKKLFDEKVISRQEYETSKQAAEVAEANYKGGLESINSSQAFLDAANAQLNRANKDLSRTTLVSPMSGIVSSLLVKKGERVVGTAQFTGTEMMRIADMNKLEVIVDVGENDIPKVKIGDSALIEVDAYLNQKFKGIVYKINNPAPSASSGAVSSTEVTNYKVHIRLIRSSYEHLIQKGLKYPFRTNMTVTADIQTLIKTHVLSIPISAVTTREKQANDNNSNSNIITTENDNLSECVFVVGANNHVKQTIVKTGIQDINNIEIVSGLKLNDKIVIGPYLEVSKLLTDSALIKEMKTNTDLPKTQ
ncbi:MAG: efflux RND transporter periplasmic adaptor subunit [Sediminibacterium sp.]|nr:efflux RND transporter periplasmic adaptor subunit [Sediminibacterium sp.]